MKNSMFLPYGAVKKGNYYFKEGIAAAAVYGPGFLGEVYEDEFFPSYYCLELYSEHANILIVNTKNAWQYTLGKAIAFDSFVKEDIVNNKPYFIVKNGNNEILGIAEKKEHSFYNIFDIGYYLRRELD